MTVNYMGEDDYDLITELAQATRVAKELWDQLNSQFVEGYPEGWLSKSTRKWVREHEQVDYQRKRK